MTKPICNEAKEKQSEEEEVSRMLCVAWSERSRENEKQKASCSSAFPCSETVDHSLAQFLSNLAHFFSRRKHKTTKRGKITGQPAAVWALTGMRSQSNRSLILTTHQQVFIFFFLQS